MQPFSLVCYYESYGTEIDFRTQGLAYIFSTNQPFYDVKAHHSFLVCSSDTSFGVGGRIVAPIGALWSDPTEVLFDPAGGLLLNSSGFFGVPRFGITRLLKDGTVDKSFGDDGDFLIDIGPSQNASILSMSFQDDGKLLLAGSMTTQINQSSAWVLARVNLNLVPEPHTAVLVGFGLLGILSRCSHLAGHIRR